MYDAPIAILYVVYVCVNNFRKHIWPRCRKFLIQMILICHSPFYVLVSLIHFLIQGNGDVHLRVWLRKLLDEGVKKRFQRILPVTAQLCSKVQLDRQIFLNSDYVLVNSLRRVTMSDFFLWVILKKNQQFRNEWPVNIFFAGNKKSTFLKS